MLLLALSGDQQFSIRGDGVLPRLASQRGTRATLVVITTRRRSLHILGQRPKLLLKSPPRGCLGLPTAQHTQRNYLTADISTKVLIPASPVNDNCLVSSSDSRTQTYKVSVTRHMPAPLAREGEMGKCTHF